MTSLYTFSSINKHLLSYWERRFHSKKKSLVFGLHQFSIVLFICFYKIIVHFQLLWRNWILTVLNFGVNDRVWTFCCVLVFEISRWLLMVLVSFEHFENWYLECCLRWLMAHIKPFQLSWRLKVMWTEVQHVF